MLQACPHQNRKPLCYSATRGIPVTEKYANQTSYRPIRTRPIGVWVRLTLKDDVTSDVFREGQSVSIRVQGKPPYVTYYTLGDSLLFDAGFCINGFEKVGLWQFTLALNLPSEWGSRQTPDLLRYTLLNVIGFSLDLIEDDIAPGQNRTKPWWMA